MNDVEQFLAGRGRLAGLLRALPAYEPPAGMEARFVESLDRLAARPSVGAEIGVFEPPPTAANNRGFEPPPSLAEAVFAEAARLDAAQAPRREATLRDLAAVGSENALGAPVSEAAEKWLRGQEGSGPETSPAAKRRRRPSWFAALGGALAASLALGVALQIMLAPRQEITTADEASAPAASTRAELARTPAPAQEPAASAPAASAPPVPAPAAPPPTESKAPARSPAPTPSPQAALKRERPAPPPDAPLAATAPAPVEERSAQGGDQSRQRLKSAPEPWSVDRLAADRAAPAAKPFREDTSAGSPPPAPSGTAEALEPSPGQATDSARAATAPRQDTAPPSGLSLQARLDDRPARIAGLLPSAGGEREHWQVIATASEETAAKAWSDALAAELGRRGRPANVGLRLDGHTAGLLQIEAATP